MQGVILGTAAYMSPEQAKGKPVDRRADIWAFGCVLYETLTGHRAFPGEAVTEILASVLKSDPNWVLLPQSTPAAIRNLLRWCLQKEPQHRLRDIGDARIEIVEFLGGMSSSSGAATSTPATLSRLPSLGRSGAIAAAFALAGALLTWIALRSGASPAESELKLIEVARLTHDTGFSGWPTWSPDGNFLAFSSSRSGNNEIYVRRIEGGQEVNITNDPAEDFQPAFSP